MFSTSTLSFSLAFTRSDCSPLRLMESARPRNGPSRFLHSSTGRLDQVPRPVIPSTPPDAGVRSSSESLAARPRHREVSTEGDEGSGRAHPVGSVRTTLSSSVPAGRARGLGRQSLMDFWWMGVHCRAASTSCRRTTRARRT